MGWQERRYEPDDGDAGLLGGLRRGFRRIFAEGDNVFSWSLPLFRVSGIAVRVHLFYVVFVVFELLWALRSDTLGFAFTAFSTASLFVLVLLHEFGHCFACRWVGGQADRILMWPLGGLASCRPPHQWKAALITTLGGPAVNLALFPVLAGLILVLGGSLSTVVFNPFTPGTVRTIDPWLTQGTAYWKHFLWSVHYSNVVLFLFNMLVVMFPMDAGRVFQELLWARIGYRRSMMVAVNVGFAVAIGLGALALVIDKSLLLSVAIFGGFYCFAERQRLAMTGDEPGFDLGAPAEFGYGPRPPREGGTSRGGGGDRKYREALKRQQEQTAVQAEVDRILAKISATGMGSLTRGERKALERASAEKRANTR